MQKLFRGSILVYTLFILMMLLVSGLALATVVLMQQRGATGLGDSANAFQAANDGFEDLIAKYKHTSGTTLSALGSCANASGVGTISQSIGGRNYVATFQKKDASGNLVSALCTDNLSDIEQVKVVATVGSSTRAIETAFATGTGGVVTVWARGSGTGETLCSHIGLSCVCVGEFTYYNGSTGTGTGIGAPGYCDGRCTDSASGGSGNRGAYCYKSI